jgi:hypothetical protein
MFPIWSTKFDRSFWLRIHFDTTWKLFRDAIERIKCGCFSLLKHLKDKKRKSSINKIEDLWTGWKFVMKILDIFQTTQSLF